MGLNASVVLKVALLRELHVCEDGSFAAVLNECFTRVVYTEVTVVLPLYVHEMCDLSVVT